MSAISAHYQDEHRREAVELLKYTNSVIPYAESWLLGDQYDETVVAPELDLEAWEAAHGSISPKTDTAEG